MNMDCVICSDLLQPSDNICCTPCGHTFHFACLTQWLQRSQSCPQCREMTTQQRIHRLYFNWSNNDTVVEDVCSSQGEVDVLNFQVIVKMKDIKCYTEKIKTLKNQNKQLRREVQNVNNKLSWKSNTIYTQKKYIEQQHAETERKGKEIVQLQKELDTCRKEMTKITISSDNRRKLRTQVKSLQQELAKVSMKPNLLFVQLMEEREKGRNLERQLCVCRGEKRSLQYGVEHLENYGLVRRRWSDFDASNLNAAASVMKSIYLFTQRTSSVLFWSIPLYYVVAGVRALVYPRLIQPRTYGLMRFW